MAIYRAAALPVELRPSLVAELYQGTSPATPILDHFTALYSEPLTIEQA